MIDDRDYGYVDEDDYRELVHPTPKPRLWAVFVEDMPGYDVRVTRWMSRERAEDSLTSLLENGENGYLASKEEA